MPKIDNNQVINELNFYNNNLLIFIKIKKHCLCYDNSSKNLCTINKLFHSDLYHYRF